MAYSKELLEEINKKLASIAKVQGANDKVKDAGDVLSKDKEAKEPEYLDYEDEESKVGSFKPLVSELKSRFGKDCFVDGMPERDNGEMLTVFMKPDVYTQNQKEFELKARQEWLYDKGFHLVSVQSDVEPNAVKLYFCPIELLNDKKD